jgi:hypothetical protein
VDEDEQGDLQPGEHPRQERRDEDADALPAGEGRWGGQGDGFAHDILDCPEASDCLPAAIRPRDNTVRRVAFMLTVVSRSALLRKPQAHSARAAP